MEVDHRRVREHISFLTTTEPPRHYQEKATLKVVTDYIKQKFKQHTNSVEVLPFTISEGGVYENIQASFGPKTSPRFIIGAHYDVAGHRPGADDNASGVAALLEIARLLEKTEKKLKLRVDLVAFALEEPPFFGSVDMGSAHYAKSLKDKNVEVKLMLALDMIGYFSEKPNSQERPAPLKAIYPSTGNFISIVGDLEQSSATLRVKMLMKQGGEGLKVEAINAPSSIPGVDFSDHRNFWTHGYPALMITDTAFYRNPHYHQKTDTIETLDFENMCKVIQALYHTALNF